MSENDFLNNQALFEKALGFAVDKDDVNFLDVIYKVEFKKDMSSNQINIMCNRITEFLDNSTDVSDCAYVYLKSILLYLVPNINDLIELGEYVISSKLEACYKYYIFLQMSSLVFRNPTKLKGFDEYVVVTELLKQVVDEIGCKFSPGLLEMIPVDERNNNLAVVITTQFLGFSHGPTKTAMDRCITIMNKLNKNVLLINTAESGYDMARVPFYYPWRNSYCPEFLELEYVEWKGNKIPYFQCEDNQINVEVIQMLIETIRNLKPSLIVEIGTGSIVASLADRMIPVLSEGLCPSDLGYSFTTCQTMSRQLNENELNELKHTGKTEDSIIYSEFASNLKERTMKISREEAGIDENAFVIAIVGARLDIDITEDFIKLMEQICDEDVLFLLIGKLGENRFDAYNYLKTHIKYVGFVDDTRAYLELCDLYLNPKRMGAGTSSVEAMDVGVPVVTPNFGDVSVNAGSDFISDSDEETIELVRRYKNDKNFYKLQSDKARMRALRLQDTETLFYEVLNEYSERIR